MSEISLRNAAKLMQNAEYIVALTGAGVSKESNVPTFRGEDGLWRNYDAMQLATPRAFANDPKLVWEWYAWRQGLIATCEPNPGHMTIAKWEKEGLLRTLITQNVDGLHIRAGSSNVLEVHGDMWLLKCTSCSYRGRLDAPAKGIPQCPDCTANLRPDVVWFGEALDSNVIGKVYEELKKADLILVVGTSSLVYPAASFPVVVKENGGSIIEVNIEDTPITALVDVHLNGPSGSLLPALDDILTQTYE